MKNLGDATKININDVPDFDLLTLGFPCQAFSVAGKRLGFEDTRGTLFFEAARIAKHKQPKYVIIENVKGLISHDKGRTIETIVNVLNDIGYVVDFEVLNSKYFNVPQNRERVFFVCIREDLVKQEPWRIKGNSVVAKTKRKLSQNGVKTFNFNWPQQKEVTKRLRDILEENVDERYYLSKERTAKLIAELERQKPSATKEIKCYNPRNVDTGKQTHMQDRVYDKDGIIVSLTAGFSGSMNVAEPQMFDHIDTTQNAVIEQFTQGDGISYCVDANYAKGTSPGDVGKGRRTHVVEEVRPVLTPDRIEKRQNGRRFKEDGEPMFTLTAQDRHGIVIKESLECEIRKIAAKTRPNEKIEITFKENGDIRPHRMDTKKSGISELNINHENNPSFTVTSSHAPKVYGKTTQYRIRRLTPLECWRLMGFDDEDFYKAKQALNERFYKGKDRSDSQLYKQAGNSIVVNVLEAIFNNLFKE